MSARRPTSARRWPLHEIRNDASTSAVERHSWRTARAASVRVCCGGHLRPGRPRIAVPVDGRQVGFIEPGRGEKPLQDGPRRDGVVEREGSASPGADDPDIAIALTRDRQRRARDRACVEEAADEDRGCGRQGAQDGRAVARRQHHHATGQVRDRHLRRRVAVVEAGRADDPVLPGEDRAVRPCDPAGLGEAGGRDHRGRTALQDPHDRGACANSSSSTQTVFVQRLTSAGTSATSMRMRQGLRRRVDGPREAPPGDGHPAARRRHRAIGRPAAEAFGPSAPGGIDAQIPEPGNPDPPPPRNRRRPEQTTTGRRQTIARLQGHRERQNRCTAALAASRPSSAPGPSPWPPSRR